VINGEVDEYYSVAPFTFRSDRAGISMRLLRTSDSSVIAFYSQRKEAGSNLTTPDRIIEKIAQRIRDALSQTAESPHLSVDTDCGGWSWTQGPSFFFRRMMVAVTPEYSNPQGPLTSVADTATFR